MINDFYDLGLIWFMNHMVYEIYNFYLQAACLNGNKAMVELLVESGADLWTENEVRISEVVMWTV